MAGNKFLPEVVCAVCAKPVTTKVIQYDKDTDSYIVIVGCHGHLDRCRFPNVYEGWKISSVTAFMIQSDAETKPDKFAVAKEVLARNPGPEVLKPGSEPVCMTPELVFGYHRGTHKLDRNDSPGGWARALGEAL